MDRDFLLDLFADFGPVAIRRMFSGYGKAGLFLRADDRTIPRFEAEGCRPFQYQTRDRTVTVMSYWQLPERLFDDPEELSVWARDALIAARQAAASKRPRTPKSKAATKGSKASKKGTRSKA